MDGEFKLILGAWGTITGTLALCLQFLTYYKHRAHIKLRVDMYKHWHVGDPESKTTLKLHVMNTGSESTRIQLVWVERKPIIRDVSMPQWAIFDNGKYIEIQGHNKHVFEAGDLPNEVVKSFGWLARACVVDAEERVTRKWFFPGTVQRNYELRR